MKTISIARTRRRHNTLGNRLHILIGEQAFCGSKQDMEVEDVMPADEFAEWVQAQPGEPTAHGLRRGLCIGCRRRARYHLSKMRSDEQE